MAGGTFAFEDYVDDAVVVKPTVTTIAGIQALTTVTTADRFITTDPGKEGLWYYDDVDVSSADNGATILIADTKRFKRVFSPGQVQLSWFTGSTIIKSATDASITASSSTLTSSTAKFDPSFVGKKIVVNGAGATASVLVTTIATYISATQVTLTAAAGTTVSNARILFGGADETSGFQAAIDYLIANNGGTLYVDGRHWIEGTVYINPTIQIPLVIKGSTQQVTDGSLGYIAGGTTLLRTVTGDMFRVNLNSSGVMVYTAPNYWQGFGIEGIEFVNRGNNSGVTALKVFKTRGVYRNLSGYGLDYLINQPDVDASANTSYCDMSVYENIRIQSSKLHGLLLNRSDSSVVRGFYMENATATCKYGLEVDKAATITVSGLLIGQSAAQVSISGGAFLKLNQVFGGVISGLHAENNNFESICLVNNSGGVEVNGIMLTSSNNNTFTLNYVKGLKINGWYSYENKRTLTYDVNVITSDAANRNVTIKNAIFYDTSQAAGVLERAMTVSGIANWGTVTNDVSGVNGATKGFNITTKYTSLSGATIFDIVNNAITRAVFNDRGGLTLTVTDSANNEVGTTELSSPGAHPGVIFKAANGNGRSQIRQVASTGGFGLGATTGSGAPNDALIVTTSDNVLIGASDPSVDVATSILTTISTTKGSIPFPKMTTTQRDAISSPAEGITIYNTTTHTINYYNGTAWKVITAT